jgi:hypothetical protein
MAFPSTQALALACKSGFGYEQRPALSAGRHLLAENFCQFFGSLRSWWFASWRRIDDCL